MGKPNFCLINPQKYFFSDTTTAIAIIKRMYSIDTHGCEAVGIYYVMVKYKYADIKGKSFTSLI